MISTLRSIVGGLFVAIAATAFVLADPPSTMNYQGVLYTTSGTAVPDGDYTMTFRLYDDATGGSLLWSETQTVHVTNGLFNVVLGTATPLERADFDTIGVERTLYLEVQLEGESPMSPRRRLTSGSFALMAGGVSGDFYSGRGVILLVDSASLDPRILIRLTPDDPPGGEVNLEGPSPAGDTGHVVARASNGQGSVVVFGSGLVEPTATRRTEAPDIIVDAFELEGEVHYENRVNSNGAARTLGPSDQPQIRDSVDADEAHLELTRPLAGKKRITRLRQAADTSIISFADEIAPGPSIFGSSGPPPAETVSHYLARSTPGETRIELSPEGQPGAVISSDTCCGASLTLMDENGDTVVSMLSDLIQFSSPKLLAIPSDSVTYFADYLGIFGTIDPPAGNAEPDTTFIIGSNGTMEAKTGLFSDALGVGVFDASNIITVIQNSVTDPIADAWTVYSSRRWKHDIAEIDNALDKVRKLRGVTYKRNADDRPDIGLIAEEVGAVIPEVVRYEENGVDAQAVDYARLVALLIEGMKEQQRQIDDLKRRLDRQTQ